MASTGMSGTSRTLRLLSVLAIAAVLVAGCTPASKAEPTEIEGFFSTDEQQQDIASCLRDAGWDVEVRDGAILADVPEEQGDRYESDYDRCDEEFGMVDQPLTDEDYAVVYDWYSEIGKCLSDGGWDVPDRPSLSTFISTYDTEPWLPWINVPSGEMDKARSTCPVMQIPGRS